MDFYFSLPLYGQFPTTNCLFIWNYATCSFLQSLLTISCSDDTSYVITFDIWEVKIMSLCQFIINLRETAVWT